MTDFKSNDTVCQGSEFRSRAIIENDSTRTLFFGPVAGTADWKPIDVLEKIRLVSLGVKFSKR
jgi:hypothetical protein